MPGYWDRKRIDRKTFLKQAGAACGAMLLTARQPAVGEEPSAALRVAMLSDTHIPADATNEYRGFRPVDNLSQVVPQVVASKPRLSIINGDAARLAGHVEDYQALKTLLQPIAETAPVLIGLGNHDDRQNFYQVFPAGDSLDSAVEGKHVLVMELNGIRLIVLDSLLYVNKVAGLLGKTQRSWLRDFLASATPLPTVLFVHHTLGDGDGDLLDVDRLFRVLEPNRFVKAVFYGHSHRYAVERRNGLYLINLPAVGYNFSDDQPVGWIDAELDQHGARLTLRSVGGNQAENGKTRNVVWL